MLKVSTGLKTFNLRVDDLLAKKKIATMQYFQSQKKKNHSSISDICENLNTFRGFPSLVEFIKCAMTKYKSHQAARNLNLLKNSSKKGVNLKKKGRNKNTPIPLAEKKPLAALNGHYSNVRIT